MFNKEIRKLAKLLDDTNIPYELRSCWDGWQIVYPANDETYVCDAVCHSSSYGHENELLEIMGLVNIDEVGDDVEGWLTAEDVFKRIQAHYIERTKCRHSLICDLIEIECSTCPFSDDENHECLCTSEAIQKNIQSQQIRYQLL